MGRGAKPEPGFLQMGEVMKGRELLIALIAVVIAVALAILAYFTPRYWTEVLLHLGATLAGLAAALIIVNRYLEGDARRRAVRPLINLVTPSIQAHHNSLLEGAWNRFGKPHFENILKRYLESRGDPLSLTFDERNGLYELVKADKEELFALLTKLDRDLRELVSIVGWSFKPELLQSAFECRLAISRLKEVSFDDSDEAQRKAAEHFIDTDINASHVYYLLVEIAGKQ
jgi:hypothetical protein